MFILPNFCQYFNWMPENLASLDLTGLMAS
jgi:hypothetical protein